MGLVLLPTRRWADARQDWQALEDAGFDHGWTYDHVNWDPVAGQPWFGAVPTLAAASTTTSRAGVGALVFSPNLHHPVTLAQDLVTLADIAGGRFVAGVGAGGTRADSRMLGQPRLTPAARTERLAEFVGLLRLLLTQGHADVRGRWFDAVEARCVPSREHGVTVPLAIAANGPRTLELAVQHGDAWVTDGRLEGSGSSRQAFRDGVAGLSERFRETCERLGRPPEQMARIMLLSVDPEQPFAEPGGLLEACAAYAQMGFTDVVVYPKRARAAFDAPSRAFQHALAEELPLARQLRPAP